MIKLLIVEDNWMMAHVIEDVAALLDIEVVGIATCWSETAKLLVEGRPDFAILDININGLIDGIQVARQLKEKEIDFLFLTAYKDIETIKEAAELSPLSYLIKPITPENLMATFLLILKKIKEKSTYKEAFNYKIEDNNMIYNHNTLMNLSKNERRILGLLVKSIGYSVSYETFFYGDESNLKTHNEATLRNVITKIRKKCPDLIIKNIKDVGYIAYMSE
ncbi:MAG: response regulator [Sulfuricurvum sp.]|jgi:DNA-binding response OmpR family regulator